MIVVISFLLLFIPKISHAGFLDKIPNQACLAEGQCGLEDISNGFVSIIELMLGALGAMALFYFIWGAIQWLTSGGNQERVTKGKNIMIGTSMAIFVTLGSYLFVDFFINDVLNVKPGYQVSSPPPECDDKPEGAECNSAQDNYVCSGSHFNEACMSKCDLYNAKEGETGAAAAQYLYVLELMGLYQPPPIDNIPGAQVSASFSCGTKPDAMSPGNGYVAGLCSGDESNVCLMTISSSVPNTSGIQSYDQNVLNNINTMFEEFLLDTD